MDNKPHVHECLILPIVACVAGVEGEGKGKKQRAKRVREGDACKDAMVFFIPPSN